MNVGSAVLAAEASDGIAVDGGALLLAVLLLALNGFFVAAEFALLAARRSRIEQLAAEGNRRARSALAGLRELTLMLAGAQLGITMCSLGLGLVAEPAIAAIFESALGEWFDLSSAWTHLIGFTLALSIVVFLHMVVGEMAPKSWAISNPERSALRLARPFRWFVTVFRPIIWFMNTIANGVVRAVGVEPQDERATAHSAADLRLLLDESAGHGRLPVAQHDLLTRSLDLSGRTAIDAMTSRRDIVAVPVEASVADGAATATRTGRSRIVLVGDDLDEVHGFVHTGDLLRVAYDDWATTTVESLARPMLVTPERRGLEDLLIEMRTERYHLALVVDEYGTTAGVVSMEDIIEELIGDFHDSTDQRIVLWERLEDGSIRVHASVRPDELKRATGIATPNGTWTTMAGFVMDAVGDVPNVGDRVPTEIGVIEVVAADGPAIEWLRIEPPAAPQPEPTDT